MIERTIIAELKELLEDFPAVILVGPRQVGKTTLSNDVLLQLSQDTIYIDLENQLDFEILKNNSVGYLSQLEDFCVAIDEVQAIPELFSALRHLIDKNRKPGRFILLGSANPILVSGVSESLAGRIAYLEITQINIIEAFNSKIDQNTHWFRGGFPDPLLASSNKKWSNWTKNFISTYVYRDLNKFFGIDLNPIILEKLWMMIAHINSGIENTEHIGRSLGVKGNTIKKYIDFMEGAFLVRRLAPWHINNGKRLVKSPKLYMRTTGLLHYMLQINDFLALQRHPAVGASWESYVIEQIFSLKNEGVQIYYYRTHNGAEVDLVFVRGITPVATVEIKLGDSPVLSRGYYEAIKDLQTTQNFLITPNSKSWITKEAVQVCSLIDFSNRFLPNI